MGRARAHSTGDVACLTGPRIPFDKYFFPEDLPWPGKGGLWGIRISSQGPRISSHKIRDLSGLGGCCARPESLAPSTERFVPAHSAESAAAWRVVNCYHGRRESSLDILVLSSGGDIEQVQLVDGVGLAVGNVEQVQPRHVHNPLVEARVRVGEGSGIAAEHVHNSLAEARELSEVRVDGGCSVAAGYVHDPMAEAHELLDVRFGEFGGVAADPEEVSRNHGARGGNLDLT